MLGVALDDDLTSSPTGRVRLVLAGRAGSLTDLVREVDRLAQPADLVLLSSRCRVPPRWIERLRQAARSGDIVATATPITNADGTTQVPGDEESTSDSVISGFALHSFPRLMIGGPECLYVRRVAIELIREFPPRAASLEALTANLCEACSEAGMVNVLADDLYVGCSRNADARPPLGGFRLRALDLSDERSALQRSLSISRVAVRGMTITVDARSLGSRPGGTQLYTVELALALARLGDAGIRVLVASDVDPHTRHRLDEAGGIEVVTYDEVIGGVELSDIVHRPQQIFTADDLDLLRLLGRRLVVTHQDLIGYHNPAYHESLEVWEQYRRVTRIALAAADRVVFFSDHSRRDAEAEDLITPERGDVVGAALGESSRPLPRKPPQVPGDRPFILCLGPDYRHKNRQFAIRLIAALRAEQGWPGVLVLAGAHVPYGSSRVDERRLLSEDDELRSAVVDLGPVDEQEREWLFGNARAVVVPSVVEGFGLVPLEAAQVGQPAIFAAQTSLREVLSDTPATLIPWDASLSAAKVRPVLNDGPDRADHLSRQRVDATRWNWHELAPQLMKSYERALRAPHRAAAVRAWQELERERYLVEVDRARQEIGRIHEELVARLGDRIALASDEGFLTAEQQRGLLRVGSRPALNRLLLWPFAVVGSVGRPANKRRTS
ncbi:MAG: glycosyltransferase [Solirubrobacteraceae bacterium]